MKNIKNFFEFLNESMAGAVNTPDGKISFFKNIKSFFGEIEPTARGLVLQNGDLYIFDCEGNVYAIHQQGIDGGAQLGFLKKSVPFKTWRNSAPGEFICVQRKKDTPEFYLSESYIPKILKQYKDAFQKFVDAANERAKEYNPSLQFFNIQKTDDPLILQSNKTPDGEKPRVQGQAQTIIRHFHELGNTQD